jgi:hypothetical protein
VLALPSVAANIAEMCGVFVRTSGKTKNQLALGNADIDTSYSGIYWVTIGV